MLRRTLYVGNSFKEFPKLADAFPEQTSPQKFDHVVVDVGSLTGMAAKAGAGLTGRDRDEETAAYVHRFVFNRVLRNYAAPNKTVALIFDGTDPLWRVFNGRYNDGSTKKFESRFYRGCCSPMNFMLEERMRLALGGTIPASLQQVAMQGNFPVLKTVKEFVLSSPGVPGPAEGKMSGWLADLSYRCTTTAAVTAAGGQHTFPPVSAQDSVALVGSSPELFLAGMHTGMKNVSTVVIGTGRGERKVFGQQEALEWMSLDGLVREGASPRLERQLRLDAVLLYLIVHGHQTTLLPSSLATLTKVADSYIRKKMLDAGGVVVVEPGVSSKVVRVGIRLRPLLEFMGGEIPGARRKDAALSTDDHLCAEYLEILGQTLLMHVDGGIGDASYLPPVTCAQWAAPGVSTPLKPPAMRSYLTMLIDKLKAEQPDPVWYPRVNRDYALVVAEQLLVSSKTGADTIRQIMPAFSGGHPIPDSVVAWFAEKPKPETASNPPSGNTPRTIAPPAKTPASPTTDPCAEFEGLVAKAQLVVSHIKPIVAFRGNVVAESAADALLKGVTGLEAGGEDDRKAGGNSFHPGARHMPSYYFCQRRGAMGPPSGTDFLPINMGVMGREQGTTALPPTT